MPKPGFGPRGGDIDRNGVVWVSLASGQFGSFDRRKCKGPLNGPKATGDHCPEGWSFHKFPGPGFRGIGDNSAESSYYSWVDQHNTLGLGENVPIATGNLNDGMIAFKDGQMIVLRVPYPMGFYAKGLDGRIDDPRRVGRDAASGPPTAMPSPLPRGRGRNPPAGRPPAGPAQPPPPVKNGVRQKSKDHAKVAGGPTASGCPKPLPLPPSPYPLLASFALLPPGSRQSGPARRRPPVNSVGRSSRNTNPSSKAMAGVKTLMKLRLVTLHVLSSVK